MCWWAEQGLLWQFSFLYFCVEKVPWSPSWGRGHWAVICWTPARCTTMLHTIQNLWCKCKYKSANMNENTNTDAACTLHWMQEPMWKKHNILCEMISPFSRYQCISEEILSCAFKFSIDPGVGECFWGKSVTIANDRDSVKHARLTLLPNSHKYTINFHNAIRCTAQL